MRSLGNNCDIAISLCNHLFAYFQDLAAQQLIVTLIMPNICIQLFVYCIFIYKLFSIALHQNTNRSEIK